MTVVGWLSNRSRATQLLSLGGLALLVGYQSIRVAGRDPDSLLAYVGGALFLLGQVGVLAGLGLLAYRVLAA
ncbi:hypothetical protein Hbl1158_09890 [Halobaculum sp. CBA1158]|uniref:hypothetical protein n=1 Tax=Halobaculum sp. CBA1158 TaxID=2904243 RepID=UPI001F1887BE|nr:hypothetical protein [Halobaculum sp. CBA1158]UIO98848.1 hypothetical protein Hbl1158_09890 [Halobaculum sp. CBA1158]